MNITKGKIAKAQKVVIYGPEGIGKSTFASKFPEPLFIDTEGSTANMDVARFDKPTSWPLLLGMVDYVKKNKPCRSLVIDTADWAEALCMGYVIANGGDKIKSIEDYGYGKGYTMLAEEWGRFLNRLQEIVDEGINVVITAHAMMRKFEQPDEMGAYDRWELKLQKKTSPMLKEWADMVLFANYKTFVVTDSKTNSKKASGGQRVMYTTHHPAWDAKNRHNLPEEIPFDFSSIAHIFTGQTTTPQPQTQTEPAPAPQTETVPAPQPAPAPMPEPEMKEATSEETIAVQQAFDEKPAVTVSTGAENPSIKIPASVPQANRDLMVRDGITPADLMNALFIKGVFPKDTPIENITPDAWNWMIGVWDGLSKFAKENSMTIPF